MDALLLHAIVYDTEGKPSEPVRYTSVYRTGAKRKETAVGPGGNPGRPLVRSRPDARAAIEMFCAPRVHWRSIGAAVCISCLTNVDV